MSDIDNQTAGNYDYDAIGNLVKDNAEGITGISWTVYGKIRQIVKGDSVVISYAYDPSGNRISKAIIKSGSTDTARTWYVRDAQGNVMSVYEAGKSSVNEGHLTQTELHLYGSSRIGLLRRSFDVAEAYNPADTTMPLLGTGLSHNFARGNKLFELSNHLGNVLVTVNDKKLGVSSNNNTIDYFNPQVVSAQDYYPFGMLQVGRVFNTGGYRFGFNGKENDNEVKGEGGQQDYGMRVYDPRLGKFLSVDPINKEYPELTPYQFASNRPIDGVDLDGLEYVQRNITIDYGTKKITSVKDVWYNSNQNNVHGKLGQGVMYKIMTYDANLRLNRKVEFLFVSRNATDPFGITSTEYGNYMGATGLYKLGGDGKFSTDYDYSLPAVDAVDNFAKIHDRAYDQINAVGANGLFGDWGTTPADEAALNGWTEFRDKYNVGDADPYNGQKVTEEERQAAWRGMTLFKIVVDDKKSAISAFMFIHYRSEAKKMNSKSNNDYNYQLFLKKYMEKDKDGNWQRKKDMWEKDEKDNWKPVLPKK